MDIAARVGLFQVYGDRWRTLDLGLGVLTYFCFKDSFSSGIDNHPKFGAFWDKKGQLGTIWDS